MLVTRGLGCGSSGHEKWTGWGAGFAVGKVAMLFPEAQVGGET